MGIGILISRHPPARLRRVEARLLLRPLVTLELVRGLLGLALPVLRIDEHIAPRSVRRRSGNAGRGWHPWRFGLSGCLVTRGRYDFVLILRRNPSIVGVIRIVVRSTPEPDRRVERRQHGNVDTTGRAHDNEARTAMGIPDATRVVAPTPHSEAVSGQQANHVSASWVVVVMAIAAGRAGPARARGRGAAARAGRGGS